MAVMFSEAFFSEVTQRALMNGLSVANRTASPVEWHAYSSITSSLNLYAVVSILVKSFEVGIAFPITFRSAAL